MCFTVNSIFDIIYGETQEFKFAIHVEEGEKKVRK